MVESWKMGFFRILLMFQRNSLFGLQFFFLSFLIEWSVQEVRGHEGCLPVHIEFPTRIDSDVIGSRRRRPNVPYHLPVGGFLVH